MKVSHERLDPSQRDFLLRAMRDRAGEANASRARRWRASAINNRKREVRVFLPDALARLNFLMTARRRRRRREGTAEEAGGTDERGEGGR